MNMKELAGQMNRDPGTLTISIKKTHPQAKAPIYATDGAGCFDLHAATVDGYEHTGSIVTNDSPVLCGTGLSFEIPAGYAMLIFSRSGHGFNHGVRLSNCVGVIDSDYRGEVKVKLNCDDINEEAPPMLVKPGDRIAQAVILPIPRVFFKVVDELTETARGTGGLGSTGE